MNIESPIICIRPDNNNNGKFRVVVKSSDNDKKLFGLLMDNLTWEEAEGNLETLRDVFACGMEWVIRYMQKFMDDMPVVVTQIENRYRKK